MIISASYKTDIPAFYGRWFMNRVRAGGCCMVNPWGGQIYEVPLAREAVSGCVFWTRNLRPFADCLPEIRRMWPFVVQYTITGYPRALETSVTHSEQAIKDLLALAHAYGGRAGVWRYDPIICSTLTPPEWHLRNFARLAGALAGVVDEVVISFAHIYRKTRRNLARAAQGAGFRWWDPPEDDKRALIAGLVQVAADRGIRLTLCAQPPLVVSGAGEARCIDAQRLSDVAGRPLEAPERGNRPGCRCAASRDIGHYDTCPHGCVYCYAVQHRSLAKRRYAAHDPEGPFLFRPGAEAVCRSAEADSR